MICDEYEYSLEYAKLCQRSREAEQKQRARMQFGVNEAKRAKQELAETLPAGVAVRLERKLVWQIHVLYVKMHRRGMFQDSSGQSTLVTLHTGESGCVIATADGFRLIRPEKPLLALNPSDVLLHMLGQTSCVEDKLKALERVWRRVREWKKKGRPLPGRFFSFRKARKLNFLRKIVGWSRGEEFFEVGEGEEATLRADLLDD